MAYFKDLTVYTYSEWPESMVNIGWLDYGHEFDVGEVDSRLASALMRLAASPVNMMRGLHNCRFCNVESPIRIDGLGRSVFLGSGEIHVRSRTGVLYSAPTLILHYIATHGYRPPPQFIDAVLGAIPDQ